MRSRFPALLVVLLLVGGCHFSKDKSYSSTDPSASSADPTYVALGDSYTTGGEIGTSTGRCLNSAAGYPTLVAAKLKIASFADASCGGATTADLVQQEAAITPSTTLVTVGIGTNDDGFATLIGYSCLRSQGKLAPACKAYLRTPVSDLSATVRGLAAKVRSALDRIRTNDPQARIVLVGYPRLLPDAGGCDKRYPLDARAADRLRTVLGEVNTAWASVAEETGATYVDTYRASQGHDICSADPWINGVHPTPGDGAALHPNAAYHREVAKLVVDAVG